MQRFTLSKLHLTDRRYVLRQNGRDDGYLDFEGFFVTAVHAVAGERSWMFRRDGIVRPIVIIQPAGDAVPILAPIGAGGGCEVTIDGLTFRWKPVRLLSGEHAWFDASQQPVIQCRSRFSAGNFMREIEVLSANLPDAARDLLVLLGGYLLVLQSMDVAAITAALVAATASV